MIVCGFFFLSSMIIKDNFFKTLAVQFNLAIEICIYKLERTQKLTQYNCFVFGKMVMLLVNDSTRNITLDL